MAKVLSSCIRAENLSGTSCCEPSDKASSGLGCTSTSSPSAPQATAALDKGYTAASIVVDAPVVFDAPGLEDTWRPENYSGRFYGDTRLRLALVKSRNLVSIRLLGSMLNLTCSNHL